jgi:DNA-binding NtrC family response regulator
MARILLVGYIPALLEERERFLRAAGHDVTVAVSFSTAFIAIQQSPIDVAIFGYTVPEEERNQLAAALKDACPSAKIIMRYLTSVNNTELADALMPTTATADELLRAINHLISKSRGPAGLT